MPFKKRDRQTKTSIFARSTVRAVRVLARMIKEFWTFFAAFSPFRIRLSFTASAPVNLGKCTLTSVFLMRITGQNEDMKPEKFRKNHSRTTPLWGDYSHFFLNVQFIGPHSLTPPPINVKQLAVILQATMKATNSPMHCLLYSANNSVSVLRFRYC